MIQVIIPTYNRSKCIEVLLRDCINIYQGKLFNFVILDSSNNDDTQKIVQQSEKVVYRRYDPTIALDDKVVGSIMQCSDDFYWLLGDGNLVDFNSIEVLINSIPGFDILEIDSVNSKINTSSINENYVLQDDLIHFVKLKYSHLTYWGATIVKTELAKEMFSLSVMDKYREDAQSWWSAALVCEVISSAFEKGNKPRIFSVYTKHFRSNPEKKERSWTKGENYFLTTFKVFDKDVYLLPKIFDDVKNDIIRIFRDEVLVTKGYLIQLKQNDVIKLKYVIKYKNDIQDVSGYYPFIFVLACVPKFCLEIAYKAYRLLKGVKR